MEAVPFLNLTDGSGCESDIATDGDTPSDGATDSEFTDDEEGEGSEGDFGYHMAPSQSHNIAIWQEIHRASLN